MAIEISDKDFESKVLQSPIPVLLDFWAPWCGPCRALAPLLDELADEYEGKVSIMKLNVDDNPATAGKFAIRSIPTLILFKDGQVVEKNVGLGKKDALKNLLDTKALA